MRSRRAFLPLLTVPVLAGTLVGCRRQEAAPEASAERVLPKPVRVVVSNPIIADLVREVGGGGVEIDVLQPPGEPLTALKRTGPAESRLVAADLIVLLGFGQEAVLEPSLARAVEAGAVVCELESGIPKDRLVSLPSDPTKPDLAIWLDPGLWREAVEPIENALAAMRPEWADEWRTRAHAVRFHLDESSRSLQELARIVLPAETDPARTGQSSLRYVARAAGVPLEMATDSAPAPGKDELESLRLDCLRPPGTKAIAGVHEHDLGTLDGLRSYALELLLKRWQ